MNFDPQTGKPLTQKATPYYVNPNQSYQNWRHKSSSSILSRAFKMHKKLFAGAVAVGIGIICLGAYKTHQYNSPEARAQRTNLQRLTSNYNFTAKDNEFRKLGLTNDNYVPSDGTKDIFNGIFDTSGLTDHNDFSDNFTMESSYIRKPDTNDVGDSDNQISISTNNHTLTLSDIGSQQAQSDENTDAPVGNSIQYKLHSVNGKRYVFWPKEVVRKNINNGIPHQCSHHEQVQNPLILTKNGKVDN